MSTDSTDAELSRLFGDSGGWAQGILIRYMHQLHSGNSLIRGWPWLAESEREKKLVQFCMTRQLEKRPAIAENVIFYVGVWHTSRQIYCKLSYGA
jgi:hypothetical protein